MHGCKITNISENGKEKCGKIRVLLEFVWEKSFRTSKISGTYPRDKWHFSHTYIMFTHTKSRRTLGSFTHY